MSKVVIANDHGGVDVARELKEFLENSGYDVNWIGTKTTDSVDYPDMAKAGCTELLKGGYEFGILCCGTGIGISIAANKIDGIRCALPQNCFAAKMAKEHNNANFLAFGGRIDYPEKPVEMLKAFIGTKHSEESRHQNRVAKIMALEKN